jgi:hypothetical protein
MTARYGLKSGSRAALLAAAMSGMFGIAGITAPAAATTLIRMGLEDLVASNSTIVVGEVLDVQPRWNEDATFIVTDVRFAASDVLKGRLAAPEFTITIPGGRIGDRAHLLIGAAELIPGNSYVLFLSRMNLMRAGEALVVRDLVQGAFDVRMARDGLRAVSQALGHPLMPDKSGQALPPGEEKGMPINTMLSEIRQIAARQGSRREVK